MTIDLPTLVALLALLGGGIAVWVQVNGRITRLEVQNEHVDDKFAHYNSHVDKQFTQIMERLKSIEDKLDHKQDRIG